MRLQRYIHALSALCAVSAAASNGTANSTRRCMSQADAQQVVDNYQNLQTQFSETLTNVSLAPNFAFTSDSITELINGGCDGPQPLGQVTFDSRRAYIAGQASQPSMSFYQVKLWHTCNQVFVRWRMDTFPPEPVVGILALEAVPALDGSTFPWLIETVYNEFNSVAWLVDLGVFVPNCTAPAVNQTIKARHRRRELPRIGHVM